MTLEKFRIIHSTLIEHYQFIESHLEGIYAAISDKTLIEGLKEVEKDGLTGVLREIKQAEKEKKITVFSDDAYIELRKLFQRRNVWCHSCYLEIAFDMETGGPARIQDAQQMMEDLENAELWRQRLFEKKIEMLKKHEKI